MRQGTAMEDKLIEATDQNPDGSTSRSISQKSNPSKRTLRGRIVGGEVSSIRSFPWQVSLHVAFTHECGGSILTNSWK